MMFKFPRTILYSSGIVMNFMSYTVFQLIFIYY